ncbi:Kelch repeat-containing protein [Actinophytocola sp.]|uniref:Kelch repeat-containing protein n=1 Tax=Actinophytocola sp. TaxID=1872138 RepID=UPI002D5439ED|nr:kelch repeat-containing protein [Actinophytocola sp.]HYQ65049.1 kelch repeat-containing protein [Actinophytocola sp.]
MTTGILATDAWSAAPDYAVAACWRGQHDAPVVLDATKILVAGGADAAGTGLRQSAVYDLTQNQWSPTALLGTARQLHALARLPGGKVLATGGISAPGGAPLRTAEIFDPAANTWQATAQMAVGRFGHSATTLSNGLVLVAGGSGQRAGGGVVALRSAELFDPADGTWETVETGMTDARTGHTAVALQNGQKVLACGGSVPLGTTDADLAFCELYDTATAKWAPTGTMRHPRGAHSATALSATTVLVAGGRAPGAAEDGFDPFARATAEVYDLAAGTWQETAPMPAGRAFHRAVPFGAGKALVLGGADHVDNEAGYRGTLQFAAGAWSSFAGLDEGRWAFAAAVAGTLLLVAGGVARTGLAAAATPVELTATAERSGT